MTTDKHELHDKISLETVARQLLDTLQNPAPPSLLKRARNLEKEIETYTKHIEHQSRTDAGSDTSSAVEEHAGSLLDSICELNEAYFETGLKTGAVLMLQLLDL